MSVDTLLENNTTETLLEIRNVHKAFGVTKALNGASFDLRRGEIHALAGENGAGKSTLMKVIDGIHQPDKGEIFVKSNKVTIQGAIAAQGLGIGFVHQEIALCPDVSVAENVNMPWINQSKKWFVNFRELNKRAEQALSELAPEIDVNQAVKTLSISQQQLVEIAKALTLDCDILILDEPTAALTDAESQILFAIMKKLRDKGIGIIYISHRMAEVFEHCDRITVLRDGSHISTKEVSQTSAEQVVRDMVGRELGDIYPAKCDLAIEQQDVLLKVNGLSNDRQFFDINFSLHRGEILGVAGLMGAGRSEMVKGICALQPVTQGQLTLANGQSLRFKHYRESIQNGIVYLSEDRKENGVFLDLSIANNVSALAVEQITTNMGTIDSVKELQQAQRLTDQLQLKSGGMSQPVSSLSGGNQQKVAIAKMLSVTPSVIIMDEPTRGIDVGAKVEIHRLIRNLANEGVGVIVISSELPEVIGLCDRVLVMHEGHNQGILSDTQLTEERILQLASGMQMNDVAQSA